MPRILVTRFPDSANAADASQLGLGPAGYNGLLYDAGFSPSTCGFMDALTALRHGGQYDLALIELCNGADQGVLQRYAKYLRLFTERALDAGSSCPAIPIITRDGLLEQEVRDTLLDRCVYAMLKPLPSKRRLRDDLVSLLGAKQGTGAPYLKVPDPLPAFEEYTADKRSLPKPLKTNQQYDTPKYVLYREKYIGISTRDESLNFYPKGKLIESTIEVLALRLGTEFSQLAKQQNIRIPVELHLR